MDECGHVHACCGADAAAQRLFFINYLRPEELAMLRGSGGEAGVEAALSKLSAEANIWALASHAYWGVWALIQVRHARPCCMDLWLHAVQMHVCLALHALTAHGIWLHGSCVLRAACALPAPRAAAAP